MGTAGLIKGYRTQAKCKYQEGAKHPFLCEKGLFTLNKDKERDSDSRCKLLYIYMRWINNKVLLHSTSFPSVSAGKESTCNERDRGDSGLILRLGRSLGGGNGSPLQYSCLENPMDRGAWWAAVQRVTKSRTGLND